MHLQAPRACAHAHVRRPVRRDPLGLARPALIEGEGLRGPSPSLKTVRIPAGWTWNSGLDVAGSLNAPCPVACASRAVEDVRRDGGGNDRRGGIEVRQRDHGQPAIAREIGHAGRKAVDPAALAQRLLPLEIRQSDAEAAIAALDRVFPTHPLEFHGISATYSPNARFQLDFRAN